MLFVKNNDDIFPKSVLRPNELGFRSIFMKILIVFISFFGLAIIDIVAQPANDDCANAIDFAVPNGGFGLGTFSRTTVGIASATLQTTAGETFRPGFFNTDHSVWYKFTIAVARNVTISLSTVGSSTSIDLVSMAVYNQGDCSPFPNNTTLNQILSLDATGIKVKNCLAPGTYLVQVGAKAGFTAEAMLTVSVAPGVGNVSYDLGAGAYDFGIVGLENSVQYIVECQTIDNTAEQNCPALSAAGQQTADYTQSTWHTFTTGNWVDYIGILLEPAGAPTLTNAVVGYWLFEGDVRTGAPLTLMDGCKVLDYPSANSQEYICELQPNTTYTVKLLFHKSLVADINLLIRKLGYGATVAPIPEAPSLGNNAIGTLPTGIAQVTISDNFACNALLTDAANTCGPANPPNAVNGTYDLSTWVSFHLDDFANVSITANQPAPFGCSAVFIRLFADSITNDCNDLSLANIVLSGNDSINYACMPPGPYSIQFLGRSQLSNNVFNHCTSNFGRPLEIKIYKNPTPQSQFGLQAAGRVDSLGTIANNDFIQATRDIFSCDSTVRPLGSPAACNPDITHTLYRQVSIGATPGILSVKDLYTVYPNSLPTGITYQFFKGDANNLAITNNTFTYATPLTGLVEYSNCINSINFKTINEIARFCVTPGTYTLASYGDVGTIGLSDRPWFGFRTVTTTHNSPANAENLDTISFSAPITFSGIDYFSCEDNAEVIDGQAPCPGATKVIYREFYLADTAILSFGSNQGNFSSMSLFMGQASTGGVAGLSAISNLTCVGGLDIYNCDFHPPGWYTLVTFGDGPNYTNFPYPYLNGGNVGDSNSIFVRVIGDSISMYNRPHKACYADTVDWGPNRNTADYPENDNIYTLCSEIFGCKLDLPFSGHPIDPCTGNNNRTAYYVFTITKPSFIIIEGIQGSIHSKVYPFDVRVDSTRMALEPPVQPCFSGTGYIQLCNLQPGDYTLVLLATDTDLKRRVAPKIYVDSVGISKFDHASNAYDFGALKGDYQWYSGQGHLATTPGRAPSNDFFYCTTGAQTTDPNSITCYQGADNWRVNNRVYPFSTNYHQFEGGDILRQPRRNLWYTFVMNDIGRVDVRVDNKTPNKDEQYPFAIYRSDVNGSIPFSQLVSSGGVDSILGPTGLTLVVDNESIDVFSNCQFRNSVSFINCGLSDTIRYYVIVDHPTDMYPNSQVEVSIRYDSVPARYDHCSTANEINGLNEVNAPYTATPPLSFGTVIGDPASFMCATADVGDHSLGNCGGAPYRHTLWYKIQVGVSGRINLALEIEGQTGREFNVDDILLLRDLDTSVNNCSAAGLQSLPLTSITQGADTFGQSCITPGTYYIFLTGCSYFFERVTPVVVLVQEQGDICANPVVASIHGVGSASVSTIINCHTMGGDFGEDGSNLICLDDPDDYKSTWFKVDVTGPDKYDLIFSLDGPVQLGPTLYRVMFGSCGNLTVDLSSCSSIGNGFSLECLTEGSYYVQVFSPIDASSTITLNVSTIINANPICDPVRSNFSHVANCTNDSIRFLNLSSGHNLVYDWDFGDGTQSTQVSPTHLYPRADTLQYITVSLTATDTINLIDSTLIKTITIFPNIKDKLGTDTTMCPGQTLTLVPYPDGMFRWQNGTNAPTFTVSASGIYTAMDSVGCIDTIVVTYQGFPTPQLADLTICAGDSSILDAGNAGSTYNWSTNEDSSSITVTSAGTYLVTITNTYGCSIVDSSTITQNPLPNVVAIGDTTICNTQSTALSATGAASYAWSNSASTSNTTVSPTVTTSYVVVGTDSIGCSNTDSVLVTVLDTSLRQVNSAICSGDSIFLAGAWQTVAGQYVVVVANVNGCDSTIVTTLTVLPNTATVIDTTICSGEGVMAAGSLQTAPGTYYDTLVAFNGCDSVITTILSVDTLDVWDVMATPDTICFGQTTTLIASGGDTYSWSNSNTSASISVSPIATSTYWVDIIIGVCTRRDSITVIVNQLPIVTITGDNIICPEDSTTLVATTGQQYLWSTGQPGQSIPVNQAGVYDVLVTDANGCIGAASFTLSHYPAVEFTATATSPTCFAGADGSIRLVPTSGTAPFIYGWSHGASTSVAGSLSEGTYSVAITDANTCGQVLQVLVTEPEKVSITGFSSTDITCAGYNDGTILMEVTGGVGNYGYSIDSGRFYFPTASFMGLEAGFYRLFARDENGCTDSIVQPIFIEEPEPISVTAEPDTSEIIFGQSVDLTTTMSSNAIPPFVFNWTPRDGLDCAACENPIATPMVSQNYLVEVTDDAGCVAADQVYILVDLTRRIFYVPNAFTPNNDGVNDEFNVYALGLKDINIKIFDRWGEVVFTTNNINQGWDGNFKGQPMIPQVLVYMVEITFLDGYKQQEKGSLTLMK